VARKLAGVVALAAISAYTYKLWRELSEVTVTPPVEVEKVPDGLEYPLNFWDNGWPDGWTTAQKQLFEDELLYGKTAVFNRDNPPKPYEKDGEMDGVKLKPVTTVLQPKKRSEVFPSSPLDSTPRKTRREELGLPHTYYFDEPDGHVITAPNSAVIVARKPKFTDHEATAIAIAKLLKGVQVKPDLAKRAKKAEAAVKRGTVRVWFGPDGEIIEETRVSSFLS